MDYEPPPDLAQWLGYDFPERSTSDSPDTPPTEPRFDGEAISWDLVRTARLSMADPAQRRCSHP
jgi:hypothetical protein